jgi:hypothetical protein
MVPNMIFGFLGKWLHAEPTDRSGLDVEYQLLAERIQRVWYCEIESCLMIAGGTSPSVEETLHAVEATTQEV